MLRGPYILGKSSTNRPQILQGPLTSGLAESIVVGFNDEGLNLGYFLRPMKRTFVDLIRFKISLTYLSLKFSTYLFLPCLSRIKGSVEKPDCKNPLYIKGYGYFFF